MENIRYIERLRERIERRQDPRLLLSLAYEMIKRDRSDEAVDILSDVIKKNPDFVAARVALIKLYISKGLFKDAEAEFAGIKDISTERLQKLSSILEAINRLNRFRDAVKKRFSDSL